MEREKIGTKRTRKIRTCNEVWTLCEKTFYYCPTHGKCPAILDFTLPNGDEMVKHLIIEPLFYCKKCGMVKMINVWNNCSGLSEATELACKHRVDKEKIKDDANNIRFFCDVPPNQATCSYLNQTDCTCEGKCPTFEA